MAGDPGLVRCPFDGGRADLRPAMELWQAVCLRCHAASRIDTRERVVACWNRRTLSRQVVDLWLAVGLLVVLLAIEMAAGGVA